MRDHRPASWRQRVSRELLWMLGCFLAVATLYVTVVSNMEGGPRSGLLDVSVRAWAVLWDEYLAGHFWIATGTLYGAVWFTRLTAWAVHRGRHSN